MRSKEKEEKYKRLLLTPHAFLETQGESAYTSSPVSVYCRLLRVLGCERSSALMHLRFSFLVHDPHFPLYVFLPLFIFIIVLTA